MCRGKPNGEVQLPQLLRAVQPEMKVVAILRDPVARMYSAFWYYGCLYNVYKDHGMTAKGFHKLATVSGPSYCSGNKTPCANLTVVFSCNRGHLQKAWLT